MRWVATVYLWFCAAALDCVCGQNMAAIRQLEAQLASTSDSSEMFRLSMELVRKYEVYEAQTSLAYANKAWALATAMQRKDFMAKTAYELGYLYQFDIREPARAIQWNLKGYQLAEATNYLSVLAECAYSLGILLNEQGDKQRATAYLLRCSEIARQQSDFTMETMAYMYMASMAPNNTEKNNYLQKALRVAESNPSDTTSLAQAWAGMGDFYWEVKDAKKAAEWFEKVYQLLENPNSRIDNLYRSQLFAGACLRTGRYDECIHVAGMLSTVRKSGSATDGYSKEATQLLAEAYYRNGYDSLAFWTMLQLMKVSDSLEQIHMKQNAQQVVLSLQSEFDTQRKEQEIQLLRSKEQNDRMLNWALGVCVLLLGAFTVFFYRGRKEKQQQNLRLAQINQTKDKLLSILSHDVKSPISALQNILNLFEQNIATKEDVRTVAQQVNASILNIAQGVDNLFFWAQSQQQELRAYPERCNLGRLVDQLLELHEIKALKKNITIENQIADAACIWVDPVHLRLILNNIFGNAVKFTPLKGAIRIRYSQSEAGGVVLTVTNTGRAIPDDDVAKILNPLIRYTRPGSAGEPGSGLGLSITSDLIQLNGGNIRIGPDGEGGAQVDLFFVACKNP